jgi:hypothetical protein
VNLNLASSYDAVSSLTSNSQVTVSRNSTSQFTFGITLNPAPTMADKTVTLQMPIPISGWDGTLTDDSLFQFVFDDGVVHDVHISALDTALDTSTDDFVALLNTAINADSSLNGKLRASVYNAPDGSYQAIEFDTIPYDSVSAPNGTKSRMLQVLAPQVVANALTLNNAASAQGGWSSTTYSATSASTIIAAGSVPSSFVFTNNAIFTINLPDGSSDTITINASDTSDNTTLADLLKDINFQIQASPTLTSGATVKVTAVDNGAGKIGFQLNSSMFSGAANWSVVVPATYSLSQPNGAYVDLLIDQKNVASVQDAAMGVPSGIIGDGPYVLSAAAQFQMSVNGSSYVTVSVPSGTYSTMSSLLTAFNTQFAATSVTIGSGTFNLGQFFRAATYGNGDQMILLVRSDAPTAVKTFRFAPDTTLANNGLMAALGFGSTELLVAGRGSDGYLKDIMMNGTATISTSSIVATGDIGFVQFASTGDSLNVTAATQSSVADGSVTQLRLLDLMNAIASGDIDAWTTIATASNTAATLQLNNLSFPGDPITGLSFGANASIAIDYGLNLNLFNLPTPAVTYTNTNGMEKLSRLTYDDVISALERTGEFISDYEQMDPNSPYNVKLLFVKDKLTDIQDFGQLFKGAVQSLSDTPATSLQNLKQNLATGLSLASATSISASDIVLSLSTSYTGNALMDAVLDISLPFVTTFALTLPLYVDLASLRARSADPTDVRDKLLGLSALSSNLSNPLLVSLDGNTTMNLNLGIHVVNNGGKIQPAAVLFDTTSVETDYNLSGSNLSQDIVVGKARLRLTNGAVAINSTGQTATPDAYGTPQAFNVVDLTNGATVPDGEGGFADEFGFERYGDDDSGR